MSIRWVSLRAVLAMHAAQIAEHGGGEGVRDQGLLESALARPLNLSAYGTPDLAALAAAYAFGVARNHPFVDGNKRTAFVLAATFLVLNGHRLATDERDVVETFLALAAGMLEEDALADWFRHHISVI
ncbi:type II toxin-antitoxin system death-on-curing family toxin [Oleomonas cavernae]|uniref:Type II toxin-antitoxin system death-on-curing family toxin n=1 Tax=Oleomonas cavernae TaxID=2320859 RepID=A0A418WI73_9PROT|nr:type II toxin-antitoxin system death-on-curing family toxin [Oleomonas cavernae]RJF89695.1 type II toxin-antitoxin system death-on-curing family toxin [Oleomonas cavernae]